MKKFMVSIVLFAITLMLTSCFERKSNVGLFGVNHTEIADKTFVEIVSAIQAKDTAEISNMFSHTVQTESDVTQGADQLVAFVRGDIVSFSSASESGVGVDTSRENRKERTEIQSAFSMDTSETKYYIAIKECITNESDHDSVGLLSFYIIEATDWTDEYVYRGDGKWTHGINIGCIPHQGDEIENSPGDKRTVLLSPKRKTILTN